MAIASKGSTFEITRDGNILTGPKHTFDVGDGLGWFMWNACDKFHDKIYQIFAETGQSETYSSFKKRATAGAIHLKQLGIKKGDVVMTCTPNSLDSSIPATSAFFLGAILSSLDPSLSARECIHLVSLVNPKIIFVDAGSLKLIEETLVAFGECKPIVVVFGSCNGYKSFEQFLIETGEEHAFKPEILNENDPSLVLFSSGTTGLPKGICLSQKSIFIGAMACIVRYNYADTMMHLSTFYWISGIIMYIGQFGSGAKRILVNKFEDNKTLHYISKYKVVAAFLAPMHAYKITEIENIARFDLSSLKFITFGGSILCSKQLTKVRNLLPQTLCIITYGMTELSGPGTMFFTHDRKLAYSNPKACGRPAFGVRIKVVDPETEHILGPHEIGEIRIDCESIMLGYYKQDSSSAFDSEGFLKTGDVGYFDENCCIYILDRIKDMFKYQNYQVVPASIESVILEHPGVAEAVVVGVPNERDGHLPAAVVKLQEGFKTSADEIERFVAGSVADRERLRGGVFVVKNIPKTPSQKVLRRKVKEMVLQNKITADCKLIK